MNTVTIGNLPLPVVIELIEALRNSGSESKELNDLKNNLITSVELSRKEENMKDCADKTSKPEPTYEEEVSDGDFKRFYTKSPVEHVMDSVERARYMRKVMANIDRNLSEMIANLEQAHKLL